MAYFLGTILFVWARREKGLRVFTGGEWIVFAVIAVAAAVGLYQIVTGDIDVF